jgi:hypothetical protein
MATFLVTGQAEYYTYIEADTEEEATKKVEAKASAEETGVHWRRTYSSPLTNVKVLQKVSG